MNTGTRLRKWKFTAALGVAVAGLALPLAAQVNTGTANPGYNGTYNQNQPIGTMGQNSNSSWQSPARFI